MLSFSRAPRLSFAVVAASLVSFSLLPRNVIVIVSRIEIKDATLRIET